MFSFTKVLGPCWCTGSCHFFFRIKTLDWFAAFTSSFFPLYTFLVQVNNFFFFNFIFRLSKEDLLKQMQMRLQDTGSLMTPILQVKCKPSFLVFNCIFFKDLFTFLPQIWMEDEGLKSSCSLMWSSRKYILSCTVEILSVCLVLQLQATPFNESFEFLKTLIFHMFVKN